MRNILMVVLCFSLIILVAGAAVPRDTDRASIRRMRSWSENEFGQFPADRNFNSLFQAAATDTYCIVWYDFECMDWQGWTRVDNTAQIDTFFHVDDFSGLGGGDYGGLVAIEGAKSMWCGARPDPNDPYMCSWAKAPGYGNSWDQRLTIGPFPYYGPITFSYHGHFDSEPDYDRTFVEYAMAEDTWVEVVMYEGQIDTFATHEIITASVQTKLRFHFVSDGAWSDQDGLWNTDGGAIVDDITISDQGGTIDYENFESASVEDKSADGDGNGLYWIAGEKAPYGKYSGLASGIYQDKDPCGDNFDTQVVFFIGSTEESTSYPGLYDTPFCKGPGGVENPCQNESVLSPVIDMTKYSTNRDENQDADIPPEVLPELEGCILRFTVYRDLPVANCVFYNWEIHNIDESGCPGQWKDRGFCYYGLEKEYIFITNRIGDLVTEDKIQINLTCMDMCGVWYGVYCSCAAHTP
ncbi:MAG: hypothetical protein KAX38_01210, partial [Candidatus Krumholzibacteria bacterium]|nr:hypothetical protein [Candidatus Krumholzibacteria bacterium]